MDYESALAHEESLKEQELATFGEVMISAREDALSGMAPQYDYPEYLLAWAQVKRQQEKTRHPELVEWARADVELGIPPRLDDEIYLREWVQEFRRKAQSSALDVQIRYPSVAFVMGAYDRPDWMCHCDEF